MDGRKKIQEAGVNRTLVMVLVVMVLILMEITKENLIMMRNSGEFAYIW